MTEGQVARYPMRSSQKSDDFRKCHSDKRKRAHCGGSLFGCWGGSARE